MRLTASRLIWTSHDPKQSDTTRCNPTRHIHVATRRDTTRHDTPRHDTTRHAATRRDTTRHGTRRHGTRRHGTTRHDTTRWHALATSMFTISLPADQKKAYLLWLSRIWLDALCRGVAPLLYTKCGTALRSLREDQSAPKSILSIR